MKLLRFSICFFAGLALFGTLAGFAGAWFWVFDLFAHFRLQYAIGLGVFAIYFHLMLRRSNVRWHRGLVGICLLGCLLNAVLVCRVFLPPVPSSEVPATSYRLLFSNVLTANAGNPDPLLKLIRKEDPEILVLQEINRRWLGALQPLAATYPHQTNESREHNFGIAIWSKLPFRMADGHAIPEGSDLFTLEIEVEVEPSFTLWSTHPIPPAGGSRSAMRNHQLAEVAKLIVARNVQSILLAGDLNTTPWSFAFQNFVRDTGLLNSQSGRGLQPSWPSRLPALLRIPIDHVLHSDTIQVHRRQLGPPIGSDHLPLLVEFSVL